MKEVVNARNGIPLSISLFRYLEFHPYMFTQCDSKNILSFPSFNKAVDDFFSKMESQKMDMKTVQKEKAALKKLENIRKDHEKRVNDLQLNQNVDTQKAQLIELNQNLVDRAILSVNHALASQMDWDAINVLIAEVREQGDPVASSIVGLKLDVNHITLRLSDPYKATDSDDEDTVLPSLSVDIDIGMVAFANAKKYYDMKRTAAQKEKKTISSSVKALKSAEVKTKQMLKDVQTVAKINKVRKTMWFEKFQWFITSENYLVVGGRDQQQNEILVKRYFLLGDVYVHADLHGAATVIVKNHRYTEAPTEDLGSGPGVPPPKSLVEAGHMAVIYSSAWQARVVTAAWWVNHGQVSKTAPSGEYLTTGSFMVRGKKNFLPPCHLVYGFAFLFKLDEDSLSKHAGERRVRSIEEANTTAQEDADPPMEDLEDGGNTDSDSGAGEEPENCFPDAKIKIDLSQDHGIQPSCKQQSAARSRCSSSITEEPTSPVGLEEDTSGGPILTSRQESIESSEGGRRRLTAKERRDLKKGRNRNTTTVDGNDNGGSEKENGDKESIPSREEIQLEKKEDLPEDKDETERKLCPGSLVPLVKEETAVKVEGGGSGVGVVPIKRGQRNKLKKMKEKYKDQDEEEREIRMAFLQSDGSRKEQMLQEQLEMERKMGGGKKNKKARAKAAAAAVKTLHQQDSLVLPGSGQKSQTETRVKASQFAGGCGRGGGHLGAIREGGEEVAPGLTSHAGAGKEDESEAQGAMEALDDDDPEDPTLREGDPLSLLDSLTGCPLEDDQLLYAVPVCAPYQTLLNYKFKVKLAPGNTKRGKAVKASLGAFMNDKTCTPREKDLLRVLKDQDLSRNFPGKVKLSGTALFKNHKK